MSKDSVIPLLHSRSILRDCWFDENGYLVIRQMKAGDDGMEWHENKQFRLSPEEVKIIVKEFDKQRGEK
jgi:hypothetical protein